jgi:3-carboxy-cis,cis-muconate cycloisomerase
MAEAVQMALGEKIGRLEAHDLLEAASRRAMRDGSHLREVLGKTPQVTRALGAARLDALFDPLSYLGSAGHFIDRALAAAERSLKNGPQRRR